VVLGVAHNEFLELDISTLQKEKSVLYDVKGVLKENVDGKLQITLNNKLCSKIKFY